MDKKELEPLRARSDAKLRYARIHLDELRAAPATNREDFDCAHKEAFLYHLVSAKEAFVGELNVYYQCGLPADGMSLGNMHEALKRKDRTSPEEAELYKLEKDDTSWLSVAKEMRDYSTHVAAVARNFYIRVGVESWESLRNPKTDQEIPGHFLDVFAGWLNKMESLLERLRKSAIATNRSGLGLP